MPKIYFIGVDVGTTSARAALVTSQGEVIKQHVEKITIWNPEKDHYEQSSDNIWNSVCECVKVSRFDSLLHALHRTSEVKLLIKIIMVFIEWNCAVGLQ